jgi:hypothetical protein
MDKHDDDEDIMTGDEIAVKRCKEKIKSLESEVAALRESLGQIAAGSYSSNPMDYRDICRHMVIVANNALTTHPVKEEK